MVAIKITVLKRELFKEIVDTYSNLDIKKCGMFKDGQEFIAGINSMPDGFCNWAWNDISKMVLALFTGGKFDQEAFSGWNGWMKQDNTAIACCTDGFRPVVFKLERINTKSLFDLSKVKDPAPLDVYESERWGEFSYTLPNLSSDIMYLVRLHFCEVYHMAKGKRRFNVELNGKPILENFDIFTEAGGAYKPIIKEFTTTADKDGNIVLNFVKGMDDLPKLTAIEIIQTTKDMVGKSSYAINAGGKACEIFSKDSFYNGGNGLSD